MRPPTVRAHHLRPTPAMSSDAVSGEGTSPATPPPTVLETAAAIDLVDVVKYAFATSTQFGLVYAVFRALDHVGFGSLPTACVPPLFAFLSLRSRIFSPLDNRRPDRKAQGGAATPATTKRPSWTPPGIAFPIIWSTISLLRTISATIVWRATGRSLACVPLLALVAHLCVGDTWNSITNAERRLGVSFTAVFGVLASVYYAVYRFYQVSHVAGYILAPSAVWISIATVLTGTIWNINTPRQPLWPVRGDGKSSGLRMPFTSISR